MSVDYAWLPFNLPEKSISHLKAFERLLKLESLQFGFSNVNTSLILQAKVVMFANKKLFYNLRVTCKISLKHYLRDSRICNIDTKNKLLIIVLFTLK